MTNETQDQNRCPVCDRPVFVTGVACGECDCGTRLSSRFTDIGHEDVDYLWLRNQWLSNDEATAGVEELRAGPDLSYDRTANKMKEAFQKPFEAQEQSEARRIQQMRDSRREDEL